jgi:hypothetical protein
VESRALCFARYADDCNVAARFGKPDANGA